MKCTLRIGQHHDLFQIKTLFEEMCTILKGANIDEAGLFLNADSGFDSDDFKSACEAIDVIPNSCYAGIDILGVV
jgi:hypothetical protein